MKVNLFETFITLIILAIWVFVVYISGGELLSAFIGLLIGSLLFYAVDPTTRSTKHVDR